MASELWVTDREPGVRDLLGELLPEAEVISPPEFETRVAAGRLPDSLVVDGTQLLELPAKHRRVVLGLDRVLICTGISLQSLPGSLVSGPTVAVLAKPFCVEDLETAAEWLRGRRAMAPSTMGSGSLPGGRRRRTPGGAGG